MVQWLLYRGGVTTYSVCTSLKCGPVLDLNVDATMSVLFVAADLLFSGTASFI